jgi:hypothetical protein
MQADQNITIAPCPGDMPLHLGANARMRREEADHIIPPRLESRVRPEFPALCHNEAMPGKDVCKFLTTEIVFPLGLIVRLGDVQ